jgi:hypothetical protein
MSQENVELAARWNELWGTSKPELLTDMPRIIDDFTLVTGSPTTIARSGWPPPSIASERSRRHGHDWLTRQSMGVCSGLRDLVA